MFVDRGFVPYILEVEHSSRPNNILQTFSLMVDGMVDGAPMETMREDDALGEDNA